MDELRLGLPGLVWLLATVVTLPVSMWIVRRYQRAVEETMATASNPATGAAAPARDESCTSTDAPIEPAPDASDADWPVVELVGERSENDLAGRVDERARRQAMVLQIIAGVAFACTGGVVFNYLAGAPLAWRIAASYALFMAFPILPAIAHITDAHRRSMIAAGALAVAIGASVTDWSNLHLGELALLMAAVWIPPGALAWLMSSTRFRCVGPITWLSVLPIVGFALLPLHPDLRDISSNARLLLMLSLACGWGLATWLGFRCVAHAYRRKRVGDLTVALDVHWLIYTTWLVLLGAATAHRQDEQESHLWRASWMFAAFIAYLVVHRIGLAWIRARRHSAPRRSLLLLRVFGHRERSQRLLDVLSGRWRYLGCINLISGADLAATTLDLPELLDFATGRLGAHFVRGSEDLQQRLADLDEEPDPDGRFRVNEFFCHRDTWQQSVHALAERSDAVLMDLRGFSRAHEGCRFELKMLIESVSLERVALLVDRTTDLTFLRDVLAMAWTELLHEDPTRGAIRPSIRAMDMEKGSRTEMRLLLAWLVELVSRGRIAPSSADLPSHGAG